MPKSDGYFDPSTYATVADRITLFYREFPGGRIITELVSRDRGVITFRACAYRAAVDTAPSATGWASEREDDGDINAVACLENTETSAIGRALANLGFTASMKRPSREEMEKAARGRLRLERAADPPAAGGGAVPSGGKGVPAGGPELQRTADAVHDLFDLLAAARRRGYSAVRAEIIAAHANGAQLLPPARLRHLERAVRLWMRRHPAVE
jgi:hypothetical protein